MDIDFGTYPFDILDIDERGEASCSNISVNEAFESGYRSTRILNIRIDGVNINKNDKSLEEKFEKADEEGKEISIRVSEVNFNCFVFIFCVRYNLTLITDCFYFSFSRFQIFIIFKNSKVFFVFIIHT